MYIQKIRIKQVFFIILIIPFSSAFADSETQTDWSGGPGVLGPVTIWGDQYYLEANVEWGSIPGDIVLKQLIVEHTVDGNFRGAVSVYSEDIDDDGDMDILGAANNDDDITWWENIDGSGTSWTEHIIDGDFDGAYSVYSEDIDGDGDMDVLGAAWIIDEITWWENIDGSGTSWIEHIVDGNFLWAISVYSEDIDGDGDMDILGAANNDDDITWWENIDGSGTSWIEHTVDGNFTGAWSVYSEDIDGDGDMDVLGAAYYGNEITWWENSDTSPGIYWTEHTIDSDFYRAASVYSEDIDGDGDMDILGAAAGDADITWWENLNGSGTSWTEHIVDGYFQFAVSVYSEDIDGDGDMDILGAAQFDHDITWWNLDTYSPEGSLQSSILDTQCSPQWASIDWNCSEPSGTDLYFQYKTSDDPENMGGWSDPIYEPCFLSGLLDRYFQYKVSMETDDPNSTPVLNDLTLNWDPLGVGDDPQVTEYLLFGAGPNPASGSVKIGFAVPELSPVELFVYDVTGRLIEQISSREYSPGVHEAQISELTPGIYFCRMISGDFIATQRFVVIE